jgi:hypothetical protein
MEEREENEKGKRSEYDITRVFFKQVEFEIN